MGGGGQVRRDLGRFGGLKSEGETGDQGWNLGLECGPEAGLVAEFGSEWAGACTYYGRGLMSGG